MHLGLKRFHKGRSIPQQHILDTSSLLWEHQVEGELNKTYDNCHHIRHTKATYLHYFLDHKTYTHRDQPVEKQKNVKILPETPKLK